MKKLLFVCLSFYILFVITEARYMSNTGSLCTQGQCQSSMKDIPTDDYSVPYTGQLCTPNSEWQEGTMTCKCNGNGMSRHCESHSYSSYQSVVPINTGDLACSRKNGCYSTQIKNSNLQTGLNLGQAALDLNLANDYKGHGLLCTPNKRWNEGSWVCNCSADGMARSCQTSSYRSYQSISPSQVSLGQTTEDIHSGRLVSNSHSGYQTHTMVPAESVNNVQTSQRVQYVQSGQTTNQFEPGLDKLVNNLQSQLDQVTNDFNSARLVNKPQSSQRVYTVQATHYQTGQLSQNPESDSLICHESGRCQPGQTVINDVQTGRLINDVNSGRQVSTGTYKSGRTTFASQTNQQSVGHIPQSNVNSGDILLCQHTGNCPPGQRPTDVRPLPMSLDTGRTVSKTESSRTVYQSQSSSNRPSRVRPYEQQTNVEAADLLCEQPGGCHTGQTVIDHSDQILTSAESTQPIRNVDFSQNINKFESSHTANIQPVEKMCVPNSQWHEGKKLCHCRSDGMGRSCSWSSASSQTNIYDKSIDGGSVTSQTNIYDKLIEGQLCTPNSQWYEGIKLCQCHSDGMGRNCSWGSTTSEHTLYNNNRLTNGQVCTPNTQWYEGKHLCRCQADGMSRHCSWSSTSSQMNAFDTQKLQGSLTSFGSNGQLVSGQMCAPNSQWNEGKMLCTCNADGMGRHCSWSSSSYSDSYNTKHSSNLVGLGLSASTMCTPNSQWNEGPMVCTCNADGMGRKCSTGPMKYQSKSSCSTCFQN